MDNDNNIISDLIITLSNEFSLKDLGSLHYFLGLEVKYLPKGCLFLKQSTLEISSSTQK